MADETIGIDIILNAGEAATSVKELRQNIKDLQAAALKAGAEGNDALASKFTAAAGKARDRVADLNKEINVLQDTGSKLGALTAVVETWQGDLQLLPGLLFYLETLKRMYRSKSQRYKRQQHYWQLFKNLRMLENKLD